jgi:hypothetical protein
MTTSWITTADHTPINLHSSLVIQLAKKSSFCWKKSINSYQSKSSLDNVNFLWGEKATQKNGRNFFLNLDTFKSCDLIVYKDSRQDISMCFKTITRLRGFLTSWPTHGWWVESNSGLLMRRWLVNIVNYRFV